MSEPIVRMLDAVEWTALPPMNEPADLYATHEGYLDIAGTRLKCYTLNDGSRVFDADSIAQWLALPRRQDE